MSAAGVRPDDAKIERCRTAYERTRGNRQSVLCHSAIVHTYAHKQRLTYHHITIPTLTEKIEDLWRDLL